MSYIGRENPIHVGMFGFGTIGTGVVRNKEVLEKHNIHLKRVGVVHLSKTRAVQFPDLTNNPADILQDPDIEMVVELIGGTDDAYDYTLAAIDSGKSVVDANKASLAAHMRELFAAATSRGVDLGFEASVCGGIQILSTLRRLQGENITSFTGIVNGTTNYILTKMTEDGLGFEEARQLAQTKGFAEKDPTRDLEGLDARDKLAVIASFICNTPIDVEKIPCSGIIGITPEDIAFAGTYGEDGGSVIKLLAIARKHDDGTVELRVNPAVVSSHHPLALATHEFNAVCLEGDLCGPQMLWGRGAGQNPTTSAVISDILHIAENMRRGTVDSLPTLDSSITLTPPSQMIERGIIRANFPCKTGSEEAVLDMLHGHHLGVGGHIIRMIETSIGGNGRRVPHFIPLGEASREDIDAALLGLANSGRVYKAPVFLGLET